MEFKPDDHIDDNSDACQCVICKVGHVCKVHNCSATISDTTVSFIKQGSTVNSEDAVTVITNTSIQTISQIHSISMLITETLSFVKRSSTEEILQRIENRIQFFQKEHLS